MGEGGGGGGLMRGIKIPQYEFALKIQGGAYLRDTTVHMRIAPRGISHDSNNAFGALLVCYIASQVHSTSGYAVQLGQSHRTTITCSSFG